MVIAIRVKGFGRPNGGGLNTPRRFNDIVPPRKNSLWSFQRTFMMRKLKLKPLRLLIHLLCILWSTTPNLFPYHIAISLIFSPFWLKNLQQRLECTLHNHKDSFLHQLVLLHSKAQDQFKRSCVVVWDMYFF